MGIWYSGKRKARFEKRCRVGGVEAETKETMERRSPVGSNIFVKGRKVYKKVNKREPKDVNVYIQVYQMDGRGGWCGGSWGFDSTRTRFLMRRLKFDQLY